MKYKHLKQALLFKVGSVNYRAARFLAGYHLLLSYCFSKIILQQSLRPFRFPLQGTETFFTIKKGIFLPLRLSCKESSTFSPSPSSSGSGDVTALRCSKPLRFMVVGPSKVCAMLCGMGPPGERWIGLLKCWFCGNLLITCRFLVNFLVVSKKKRNFGGKVERLIDIEWNRLYLTLLR